MSTICVGCLAAAALPGAPNKDWPNYNGTLASDRYSTLSSINTGNVGRLAVQCTYDTGQMTGFQTGLIEVAGLIYGTTEKDTFAIEADTCVERWRSHEDFTSGFLRVNRGVAYMDGRIFRGTKDGRVLAYNARTGKSLWEATIADPDKGESVPAAPIAWRGLVFVGNAGGDNKGVKGRMYALDGATGRIVWEFFLVPRQAEDIARGPQAADDDQLFALTTWNNPPGFPITGGATWTSYTLDTDEGLLYVPGGNPGPDFVGDTRLGDNLHTDSVVVLDARTGRYIRHFQLVPHDLHDWDVSTAPAIVDTRGGRKVMAIAPKDGHLYGYDVRSSAPLYRTDVTTIFNADAPLTPEGTRFCPGTQGGAEWNGVAYDPATNLLFTGETDWCVTIHTVGIDALDAVPIGQTWSGDADGFGQRDAVSSGWFTASDADSGAKKWQIHLSRPLVGGVTPTAGGVVFFGDIDGNFFAYDTERGEQLWSMQLDGAVGGGVITYDTGQGQKVAVAAGMTSPIWPTPQVTARVVVLGLAGTAE
jgi:alcohol dehydrogenase (cytochrome c)